MPWKETLDPYRIWISEVILQQTRVHQGWDYYLAFIKKFPDNKTLAQSSLADVLKAWEGLGYYTRARNLHKAAKKIEDELGGKFPQLYKQILSLPGIGPYTAAAVASFAFNLPNAVVDGNVIRVLSRYFGLDGNGDERILKKEISEKADKLIQLSPSSAFNQAIMNFGALQCIPHKPDCTKCQMNKACFAFNHMRTNDLPPKKKKILRKNRFFIYCLIHHKKGIFIEQRTNRDIWQHLYQLPCFETDENWSTDNLPVFLKEKMSKVSLSEKIFHQTLTHQNIFARIIVLHTDEPLETKTDTLRYSEPNNLHKFAFPKLVLNILQQQAII